MAVRSQQLWTHGRAGCQSAGHYCGRALGRSVEELVAAIDRSLVAEIDHARGDQYIRDRGLLCVTKASGRPIRGHSQWCRAACQCATYQATGLRAIETAAARQADHVGRSPLATERLQDLIWAGGEMMHVADADTWYVIVGDGPDLQRLQQFRDDTRADNSVRFVGHRTDAVELLSAADVLWNGSLYEGQSNTILEAMALGIPVVASDIPGNRDLIEHEKSGFLVRPAISCN